MDTDMEIDNEEQVDVSKLNLETENEAIEEEKSSDEEDDYMAIFLADMYMSSNLDETLKDETTKAQENIHNDAIDNLRQNNWDVDNMETEPSEIPQVNLPSDINAITEQMDNIVDVVQKGDIPDNLEENDEIGEHLFEEMTNYIVKYIRPDEECVASLINDIIWKHMPPYLLLKINKKVFTRLVEFARFAKDPESTTRFHA